MAVVDAQLRVHGIAGLRVADASIMPTLTSGNTNARLAMCLLDKPKGGPLIYQPKHALTHFAAGSNRPLEIYG